MPVDEPGRRITAADVARSLGVSRATVGFVLNDTPGQTISAATRERVLAEARRLGYRPHRVAQALAGGHTRIILLVLPDWPMGHSLGSHLDEASLVLDEAGYALVTWIAHAGGRVRPIWEILQPDVVIATLPLSVEDAEGVRASGARLVDPAATSDALEFGHGPVLQVRHLGERGHHRIAFARPADPRLAALADARAGLARAAARELGIEYTEGVVDDGSAAQRVGEWVDTGVSAVAAYNDDIAAMTAGAALRRGLRLPDDLAVIGHDNAPIARLMVPALSSVDIDAAGMGRYLAELALTVAGKADAPVAPPAAPVATAVVVPREST